MKYKFEGKSNVYSEDEYGVRVSFESEDIEVIVDRFKQFLQACGYGKEEFDD